MPFKQLFQQKNFSSHVMCKKSAKMKNRKVILVTVEVCSADLKGSRVLKFHMPSHYRVAHIVKRVRSMLLLSDVHTCHILLKRTQRPLMMSQSIAKLHCVDKDEDGSICLSLVQQGSFGCCPNYKSPEYNANPYEAMGLMPPPIMEPIDNLFEMLMFDEELAMSEESFLDYPPLGADTPPFGAFMLPTVVVEDTPITYPTTLSYIAIEEAIQAITSSTTPPVIVPPLSSTVAQSVVVGSTPTTQTVVSLIAGDGLDTAMSTHEFSVVAQALAAQHYPLDSLMNSVIAVAHSSASPSSDMSSHSEEVSAAPPPPAAVSHPLSPPSTQPVSQLNEIMVQDATTSPSSPPPPPSGALFQLVSQLQNYDFTLQNLL